MDRVRFGRALGAGAREAARALVKAADAAAAPNPNASATAAGTARTASPVVNSAASPLSSPVASPARDPQRITARPEVHPPTGVGARAARQVSQARRSAATTTAGVKEGSARFGKAVWGPFVKLSGVLWLEVTGVFFGLFALTAAIGIWKSRASFSAGGVESHRLWFAVGMLVVFGYFSASSFMRARRRGRG